MKIYKIAVFALLVLMFATCRQATEKTLSPTETMRALNEAGEKKDVATIKKLISKGTLEQLEQSARNQNSTVDALLTRDVLLQELPEMRSEKIEGDRATIEIKSSTMGTWESMPFVKEDGAWKIEFDKFLDEMQRKYSESMTPIPVNSPSAVNEKTTPANAARGK